MSYMKQNFSKAIHEAIYSAGILQQSQLVNCDDEKRRKKTPKIITYVQCQKYTMKILGGKRHTLKMPLKNRHLVIAPKKVSSCYPIYHQTPSRRLKPTRP